MVIILQNGVVNILTIIVKRSKVVNRLNVTDVVPVSNTYRDDISDGYSIPDEKLTIGYSIPDEIPTTCFQLCELV